MPSPLDSIDIDATLSNGNNCDGTVNICGYLIPLASTYLKLVEGLETLAVLSENGAVPAPFVDVSCEDTPKRRFCNSRVLHCHSKDVLVTFTETEPSIGDIPGTLDGLVLSHECLCNSSVSLGLKPLLEPIDGSTFKVIQVSLSEVALVAEESVHSCVEITTEYHSVSFSSQRESYLNVLWRLVKSMEGIKCCNIGIITHELGIADMRPEYITEECVTNWSRQLIGLCIWPGIVVSDKRYPRNLKGAQHFISLFILSVLSRSCNVACDYNQVNFG